jgi:general secretion pathway protein G
MFQMKSSSCTSHQSNSTSFFKEFRGFTLIELLVVVAIIGLLAAYVAPKYFSQIGKSEHAVAKAQVEGFSKAIGTYRIDVGTFPSTEEGLAALVSKPSDTVKATKWNGPYLQKAAPNDPWGRPYIYRSPGSKSDFELTTYGSDGQPGGVGDAADITGE